LRIESSVQIIWQSAAREAVATEFEYIEPVHFFIGIVKFAEIPTSQIKESSSDNELVTDMVSERNTLRKRLNDLSIEVPEKTNYIRSALRKLIGKGGSPYDGKKVMHRSLSSREVFQIAQKLAKKNPRNVISASNLLDAIVELSFHELKTILPEKKAENSKQDFKTPLLQKYCRRMNANPTKNPTNDGKNKWHAILKDPVCKVLMDRLSGYYPVKIVLIQKGSRSPADVMEDIAYYYSTAYVALTKKIYIYKLDISNLSWISKKAKAADLKIRMQCILQEAAQQNQVVLFLNRFEEYFRFNTGSNQLKLIITILEKSEIRLIVGINEENYSRYIENNARLKKLLRPLWIISVDSNSRF